MHQHFQALEKAIDRLIELGPLGHKTLILGYANRTEQENEHSRKPNDAASLIADPSLAKTGSAAFAVELSLDRQPENNKRAPAEPLTTPMTEGSHPLYRALGPSSLATVFIACNIPLYRWLGPFTCEKAAVNTRIKVTAPESLKAKQKVVRVIGAVTCGETAINIRGSGSGSIISFLRKWSPNQ